VRVYDTATGDTHAVATVVPRYSEMMDMVITSHVCPDCVDDAIREARAYLKRALETNDADGPCGEKVIEDFEDFFSRADAGAGAFVRSVGDVGDRVALVSLWLATLGAGHENAE